MQNKLFQFIVLEDSNINENQLGGPVDLKEKKKERTK